MLSRDQILKADDTKVEMVKVPEWGGEVFVRVLSGAERDRFELSLQPDKTGRKPGMENFRSRLAVLCLCDDKGARLFEERDLAAMGTKSAAALDRVMTAALRLNGLSADDVESLAGESAGDRNAASGSGSPLPGTAP